MTTTTTHRAPSRPTRALAAVLVAAALVLATVAVLGTANAAPTAVQATYAREGQTCTTSSTGYCTVSHGLGTTPEYVGISNSGVVLWGVDNKTSATFRVRFAKSIASNGTVTPYANTSVRFDWAAVFTPPPPPPTTPPPTTTEPVPTTVPPTTVPPTQPPTTPAPTTTAPPVNPWVDPADTGARGATTGTGAAITYDEPADFSAANGWTGSGSQTDPYTLDHKLVTGRLLFGCACGSSALSGVHVLVVDSRVYGNGANPTPSGSAFIWNRRDGVELTVEHSTLAPNQPAPVTAGTDKGIYSARPFTARYNNIYGTNVPLGFETERSDGPTLIEYNWLHDIWSCCLDHTDLINGNFHASHGTARFNLLDGTRNGSTTSTVTNAIGLYDDPATSAGIIEDWLVQGNRFMHYTHGIWCNGSTSRFLNPFGVIGNVLDAPTPQGSDPGTPYNCRPPSSQSGNTVAGVPTTFN